jgi:hypothetical protein
MTRTRWTGLGILTLVLVLPPVLPRGNAEVGVVRHHGAAAEQPALTAGYGRLSPAFRHTIARVVSSSRAAVDVRGSTRSLVDDLVRCATFDGQRYCLGQGWTDRTQAQVRARTAAMVSRQAAAQAAPLRAAASEATGELSPLGALQQMARMSPRMRAASERVELTQAARSVAKVWLIRHQIQGVALPAGFLAHHPEVRQVGTATSSAGSITSDFVGPVPQSQRAWSKRWRDYPPRAAVLSRHDVSQQVRTYWCGPASMQMIAWGWSGRKRSQQYWANRLGTTTSGSSMTEMVNITNRYTGWDRQSYAGPYISLDIGDWSFREWMLLMARHTVDYRAPVILNPVLLKQYFPYLDHDGSGHFQVGRGYEKRARNGPLLGYFEPWNQQRFHPDEPFISRVQWRPAYRSYRAIEANFHTVGV